jgi:hypothetical protein
LSIDFGDTVVLRIFVGDSSPKLGENLVRGVDSTRVSAPGRGVLGSKQQVEPLEVYSKEEKELFISIYKNIIYHIYFKFQFFYIIALYI